MLRKRELISGKSLDYEYTIMCRVMMVMSLLTRKRENRIK